MEPISLSDMIRALEQGTKLHICVTFLGHYGNQKTKCTQSQRIHDRPVCRQFKNTRGLSACYRCRHIVEKTMIRHRSSIAGLCVNGVYEYGRPIVYNDQVICVVYVGNVLPAEPSARKRLEYQVGPELLQTMEDRCSPEDCAQIADALESYVLFLFDRYGTQTKTFDPLMENIKSYIRENLTYDLTLSEIAAAFGYTEKYMGQLFKTRTGQTVKAYCNTLKIAQAKTLLSDTDLSIALVSDRAGFNSPSYFDRVFQTATGMSPQTYRHTHAAHK